MKNITVSILETSEGYFLVTDRKHTIMGFSTVDDGLAYYENGYKSCHSRGYEASMSACINNIFFRPSIVQFDTLEDLANELFADSDNLKAQRISNISGSVFVLVIDNQEHAKQLWEQGKKPHLI